MFEESYIKVSTDGTIEINGQVKYTTDIKTSSFNSSGSKYLKNMVGLVDGKADVYSVLSTFEVTCPARQHAIKKLLFSGKRGKGDELQDLEEAKDAIERAIQLLKSKKG